MTLHREGSCLKPSPHSYHLSMGDFLPDITLKTCLPSVPRREGEEGMEEGRREERMEGAWTNPHCTREKMER